MWTSSHAKGNGARAGERAAVGVVTAGGRESSVFFGTERRGLPVAAPGGYRWSPKAGESVLVLKTGMDGESAWILAQPEQQGGDLVPGEVELTGPDCALKLAQLGVVEVRGQVSINGISLEELIASEVRKVLEQGG